MPHHFLNTSVLCCDLRCHNRHTNVHINKAAWINYCVLPIFIENPIIRSKKTYYWISVLSTYITRGAGPSDLHRREGAGPSDLLLFFLFFFSFFLQERGEIYSGSHCSCSRLASLPSIQLSYQYDSGNVLSC